MNPLVDPSWLLTEIGAPDLRLIDLRWYLDGRSGRDAWRAGHLPGAVWVDLHDVTAPTGPGRHPIPSPAQLGAALRRAGVNAGDRVVVYDDAGGSVAARLWWLLRYHGHDDVAVLDGGIDAWRGRIAVGDEDTPVPGTFVAGEPRSGWTVDKDHVVATLGRSILLDARAPERFRGEVEPIDPRPGHIPGARSAPFAANLGPDRRFRPAAELRAHYASLGVEGAEEVVVYCGSGVTACHDLLAIEVAGLPAPKLYEGSWSDWARDPGLPAASGA